jgi:predicted  nucleic acid-binding Zn-ribbon protein
MAEITEQAFRQLKREVEDAKAEADRAQGALDQLLVRLKEEFECDSLKDAKTLLTELHAKMEKAQSEFDKAFRDYQTKWHPQ